MSVYRPHGPGRTGDTKTDSVRDGFVVPGTILPIYSSGEVVRPTDSLSRFTPSTARTERVSGT